MNKTEWKFCIIGIVAGVVAFLFFVNSYYTAADSISVPAVPLNNIPAGAEKVNNVFEEKVTFDDITYGSGANLDFVPDKSNDLKIYENGLDKIFFSFGKSNAYSTYGITLYIRGVDYGKLPIVYDYKEEFYIYPAELRGFTWYEPDSYSITEKVPWEIIPKTAKSNLFSGIAASAVTGGVTGAIVYIIIACAYSLIIFVSKLFIAKKEKTEKSE